MSGSISLHPLTASATHLELSNKVSTGVDAASLSKLKAEIYNNCGEMVRCSDGQLIKRGGASCAIRQTSKSAKHAVTKPASQKAHHKSVPARSGGKTPSTKIHKVSAKTKVTVAHKQQQQKKGKSAPKQAARRPAAAQKKGKSAPKQAATRRLVAVVHKTVKHIK
ncbi:hypothetical protein CVT25_012140 [Psilocybe cyanescens]|uniref:Uncharacterized protein n=1 Tax=Psilocybe cyanescens TaxID=93625 RepID=A0A409XJ85_PSICY|nr:hypothetical protein CVT25_012140 [Psilocybe cyanescens]